MRMAPHPAIAHHKACHVGDAVAVVIAKTPAAAIAAPAAVMNAVTDAVGTEDITMPATPHTVWKAIRRTTLSRKAE